MGITQDSLELVYELGLHTERDVLELGCQCLYLEHLNEVHAKPYLEEWFNWKITSIDLTGCYDSQVIDLREPHLGFHNRFDLVTNFGCMSYISDREGFWRGYWNADNACRVGGVMLHRTAEQRSWPKLTKWFVTLDFYRKLAAHMDYNTVLLERRAAMGNTVDGYEVLACLQKTSDKKFVDFETFDQFGFYPE